MKNDTQVSKSQTRKPARAHLLRERKEGEAQNRVSLGNALVFALLNKLKALLMNKFGLGRGGDRAPSIENSRLSVLWTECQLPGQSGHPCTWEVSDSPLVSFPASNSKEAGSCF